MTEVNRVKDQLKGAAFALAALSSRAEAVAFLKQIAREIEDQDWQGNGNR